MLKIIANEIVNRLKTYKAISTLSKEIENVNETKKKVAHNIRGSLAGIIGLSELINAQGKKIKRHYNGTIKFAIGVDTLFISVGDTGIAIDRATIDNLLKGDEKYTDGTAGEKGYGFGLALVKHLIDNMNGTLQITSTPNVGAKFEVSLPMKHHQIS